MKTKKIELLKQNINELKTPLTTFWFENEDGNKINFDLVSNTEKKHLVFINDEYVSVDPNNYYDCQIRIKTKDLSIGKNYYFHSSNELEWRTADERLATYGTTKRGTTLAISFPEYNEEEVYHQLDSARYSKTRQLDENKFEYCYFDFTKQPFRFSIYDYKYEYIYLPIAWITGIKENMLEYESAVEVWTWTI